MALTGREMRPCWPRKVAVCMGVDKAKEAKEFGNEETEENLLGTGDQGMMFGYATSGKGRS